jgi:hypothetical protein
MIYFVIIIFVIVVVCSAWFLIEDYKLTKKFNNEIQKLSDNLDSVIEKLTKGENNYEE